MNEPTRPTISNKSNNQYWPASSRVRSTEWDNTGQDNTAASFAVAVWEVMDQLGNCLILKQSDYGPGNVNNAFGGPMNGLMVRIGDKFERLKNLLNVHCVVKAQ